MSFSPIRLAAGLLSTALALAACGDSLGLPPALFDNVVDTTTLFALRGTDISAPSGFDLVNRLPRRTELGESFDLAFDIDPAGRPLIYPATALGLTTVAGIQRSNDTFDRIQRAPTDGYESDSALVVQEGTVFLARSRTASDFCSFLGSLPRFGKFHILTIDDATRSMTFEHVVNANCGFRSLVPGPVEN